MKNHFGMFLPPCSCQPRLSWSVHHRGGLASENQTHLLALRARRVPASRWQDRAFPGGSRGTPTGGLTPAVRLGMGTRAGNRNFLDAPAPPENLKDSPVFNDLIVETGRRLPYLNVHLSAALTASTDSFASGRVGRRFGVRGCGDESSPCGERIARPGAEDLPAPWKGLVIKLAGRNTREATDGASNA